MAGRADKGIKNTVIAVVSRITLRSQQYLPFVLQRCRYIAGQLEKRSFDCIAVATFVSFIVTDESDMLGFDTAPPAGLAWDCVV